MKHLINSRSGGYAVIEARWTNDRPERFVVAYPDEDTLRDLVAAPSIIAFDFTTREAAVASIEVCPSVLAPREQVPKANVADITERCRRGVWAIRRRFGKQSASEKLLRQRTLTAHRRRPAALSI